MLTSHVVVANTFANNLSNKMHLLNKPVSESCPVAKSENLWQARQSDLVCKWLAATKAFWFSYPTALWPMKQSSILSANFDCPVAHQNFSPLATGHDCETGLYINKFCCERLGLVILDRKPYTLVGKTKLFCGVK